MTQSVFAQAGLRESLDLLDRDQDGRIQPDEITPLARPYLERIAKSQRISLDRENRIDRLQEAARIYHAIQNGVADERIRIDTERALKGFRPDDDQVMVPEFGLPEVKYRYTIDDLEEAEGVLRRYDRNDDNYLDRSESRRVPWRHRDPFAMDLDKDDRLSRLELTQRYARRRMLDSDKDELIQRARRIGNGIVPSMTEDERRDAERRKRSEWWRSGGDRFWLAAAVMGRFDKNDNGRLEPEESANIGIPAGSIDIDGDGEISRDELFTHFKDLQDQSAGVMEGLPGWFYERDENRDGQVDLREFDEEFSDARVEEFVSLDTNNDGLLTAMEVISSSAMTGGVYENTNAEMLPPKKTIVSEIEIEDSFAIADLNVQIAITHTHTSHLDAYITSPDGTRVELFTGVGGRDDHFDNTIFDDQAETPIAKARPPFEGRFRPEPVDRRQPGLWSFNGKSAEGVWQLTVRGSRSDRFGMLHRWSLNIRPDEETLLRSEAEPEMEPEEKREDQEEASRPETNRPDEKGRKWEGRSWGRSRE
ncbi:MAG: proprotein convertase P-domain-containing protein [Planctomycetota bacterium]